MTTVVFSSVMGPGHNGGDKWNGGYKLYNVWIKLLRQNNVEAYWATRDGTREEWLIEHQPVISLDTVRQWKAEGRDLKYVTCWLGAREFIEIAEGQFYYFDAELAHTINDHRAELERYWDTIIKIGTHSRTQQAWYMANYGYTPKYIREWSDTEYWMPDDDKRVPGRIGYMYEGPHTQHVIDTVRRTLLNVGLADDLVQIQGDERHVLETMQTCDLFLGLNMGKDALWGEGCPRAQQEAMHAGAVVIAFDVHGNREYLIDGHTGILVPYAGARAMASAVKFWSIPQVRRLLEPMRNRSIDLASNIFGPHRRLHRIWGFLDLA